MAAKYTQKERIRILSDNDGHKYFVPESKVAGFDAWLEAMESGKDYEGQDYEDYTIGSSLRIYTFLDPKEDYGS